MERSWIPFLLTNALTREHGRPSFDALVTEMTCLTHRVKTLPVLAVADMLTLWATPSSALPMAEGELTEKASL